MMSLLELAERVEALAGPDREVDVAIGLTGRFYVAEPRYPGAEPMIGYVDDDGSRVEPGNGAQDSLVPRYTASVDAAMTLIDGDTFFHMSRFSPESEPRAEAHVYPNRMLGDDYEANAATPALALVSAALRARASLNDRGERG